MPPFTVKAPVGASDPAAAQPQRAGADNGATGVSVRGCEDGGARAALLQHATAGDDVGEGEGVRAVDREDAVVGDIAADGAAGAAVAELQRAAVDGCASAVGVVAGKDGRAGKHVDCARAGNRWRKNVARRRVVEVERARAGTELHGCRIDRARRDRRVARSGTDVQSPDRAHLVGHHNRAGATADVHGTATCNSECARAREPHRDVAGTCPCGACARDQYRTGGTRRVTDDAGRVGHRAAVLDDERARARAQESADHKLVADIPGRAGIGDRHRAGGAREEAEVNRPSAR